MLNDNKIKLWVGDVCYHTMFQGRGDLWDAACEKFNYFDDYPLPTLFEDRLMTATSTSHGDGIYYDQHMREYPVDAGIIGYVEWKPCDPDKIDGMVLMEFATMPALSSEDGYINLGSISINTNWVDDEDEASEYDSNDEEEDHIVEEDD
jgi:hypothetical protein